MESQQEAIDFAGFIMSLASQVFIAMGEQENPESGATGTDLCLARDYIQILELLQEKTRGNLTEEERGLLDSILIDIRIKYVSRIKECK
ncbi:DUF1844 domain-containing protein [Myxococcota bacterium]|nr:DUF1844 domain-containing protein [Myxococcota bacterium]MBU1382188.1 DUF1844 domain-containing protein [Myxococcota bacterium]MBU1498722.1 DUF1844 domain-containing protein [Myxococcota bacterium]